MCSSGFSVRVLSAAKSLSAPEVELVVEEEEEEEEVGGGCGEGMEIQRLEVLAERLQESGVPCEVAHEPSWKQIWLCNSKQHPLIFTSSLLSLATQARSAVVGRPSW